MNNNPIITIIIPVYNVEQYLDACLDSVVHQTYQNLEIILVDDGSTDQSGTLVDQWQKKDQRIKVIHKSNGGLSQARNVGIDQANGDYIMFVDSDDLISLSMCQTMLELAKENHSDLVICDALHIFELGNTQFTFSKETYVYNGNQAIEEMWYQKSFLPSAWGKLYCKDLFTNIRFTEGIIFEDIDIMHEVFYQAKTITYNKSQLYGYIHHEDSITTKPFALKDVIILDICDKIMSFAQDKGTTMQNAAKAYSVVGALRVYIQAPQTKEFLEYLDKSQNILKRYSHDVLHDSRIRKKTRYALILYLYLRPLLKTIYRRVDRWK